MKSLKTGKRFSYKDLLYKSLIFIATVSVIVYFCPMKANLTINLTLTNHGSTDYYKHRSISPIYKNDMQVQKEQDSILATYQPYFHIEKKCGKRDD